MTNRYEIISNIETNNKLKLTIENFSKYGYVVTDQLFSLLKEAGASNIDIGLVTVHFNMTERDVFLFYIKYEVMPTKI